MLSGKCLPVECNYYDNFPGQKMQEIRAKVKSSIADYEAQGLSKSTISSKVYRTLLTDTASQLCGAVANLNV